MKLSSAIAVIFAAYLQGSLQPLMLWGPPGVGKSAGARQAAEKVAAELVKQKKIKKAEDFGFIDLRLSLLEPIDLRGLPMPKGAKVEWILPDFLPRSGFGILFLDEIVQANPSMQAAASQLILDRRIGEYRLPDGWMVVAAGNRKSDRASATSMPTHIANRFVHLSIEVNVDEWIAWALQHDIDVRAIAFIKWRPLFLHHFDPQAKGEAFASPRSWEFADRMLKAGLPAASLAEVLKGTVGEGPAVEFAGFLAVFDKMPDIDSLLLNPEQAVIPSDPATLYALTSALVHRADKDNLGKIARFFGRVKDAQHPEFAVKALKEISFLKPELCKTRSYAEWSSRDASLIA